MKVKTVFWSFLVVIALMGTVANVSANPGPINVVPYLMAQESGDPTGISCIDCTGLETGWYVYHTEDNDLNWPIEITVTQKIPQGFSFLQIIEGESCVEVFHSIANKTITLTGELTCNTADQRTSLGAEFYRSGAGFSRQQITSTLRLLGEVETSTQTFDVRPQR